MQDIHTIGVGGGGRLFGGVERRIRQHHHPSHGVGQSLKCPRCDSANTKFCYYNNYNLSQPRHFCKACRRYWTKGGVLRNVPVGGGCRKTKRNPKSPSDRHKKSETSQSSSDSSSLTASAATPEIASDAIPNTVENSSSPDQIVLPSLGPKILDFSQDVVNPTLDPMIASSDLMDKAGIRSFTSLMTSSTDPLMESDFGYRVLLQSDGKVLENQNPSHLQWTQMLHPQEESTTTMPEELKITGGFLDQSAHMDISGRHTLDHELFDLTGTVDQAYWSQPQWNDNDHALYLP